MFFRKVIKHENNSEIRTPIDIMKSLRGKPSTASVEDVFYCFRLILGRDPNDEELTGHISASVGRPIEDVVRKYIGSREFSDRELQVARIDTNIVLSNVRGIHIYVNANDPIIGAGIIDGVYEKEVVKIFRSYLKPEMRVLDIGANMGFFSLLSAAIVGEKGKVFAVEPNIANVKLIQASARKNNFENIEILAVAASDKPRLMFYNSSFSNGTTSIMSGSIDRIFGSSVVPSFPLDGIIDSKIDFLKIDVEGAEFLAMKGAENLLKKYRPTIISEFTPNAMPSMSGIDGEGYLKFLGALGYKKSVINPDGDMIFCSSDEEILNIHRERNTDHVDLFLEAGPD